MKNYTLLIAKFFCCTLAEALPLLDEMERDCLDLEMQMSRAYTIEVTPLHRSARTLFGVGSVSL